VAYAGQHLQAIVDANKAIVAGVRGQLVLVHNIHPGSRNSKTVAQTAFHTEAQVRTILLPAHSRLEAADIDVALATLVLGHIILQHFSSKHILGPER
jgi:hypothetical protein